MRRLVLAAVLAALILVPAAQAWTWPASGAVLEPFLFDPAHPFAAGQHRGIVIGADPGAPVLAPAAGVVTFAGTVPSSGKSVTITTPDGLAVTLTHLGALGVSKNATVAEGATVATATTTGDADFSQPYVHLGVRVASDAQGYLDPLTFLPQRVPVPPALVPPAPVEPAPQPAPAAQPAPAPVPVVEPAGPPPAVVAPTPAPVAEPAPLPPADPAPVAPAMAAAPEPAPAALEPAVASAPVTSLEPAPVPAAVAPAAADDVPPAADVALPAAEIEAPARVAEDPPAHGPVPLPAASSAPPRADIDAVASTATGASPRHGIWLAAPAGAWAPIHDLDVPAADAGSRPRPVPTPASPRSRRSSTAPVPLPAARATPAAVRHHPRGGEPWLALTVALLGLGLACAGGARRKAVPTMDGHALLRDHTDLLRQRPAAHRSLVHDHRGRHPRAPSPAARRGDVLPDGSRRARDEGLACR